MSNQREPENLAFDNERSLQTLVRTITLSQGQFSLILLRCNYAALRQGMVQRLHQLSPVPIREITLPASVKTLYTNIREQLGDEQPPALMIFGLESVKDIDTVLTSANQVREEFRKNFPFPILLWVNDQVLQKLIRLATDLESWATIIDFENPTDELVSFLQQKSDEIFAGDITPNPQMCREIETARQDLQNRQEVLEPALQASLEFVLGLNDYLHDEIDSALTHYQQSLEFWQQSNYLERQGILLVNIASVYNRQAEKNQTENQRYWQESKNYLQQAIETFELAQRSDLVAKYITKLGEVLRRLQAWSELQSLVEKSLPLHQNYGTSLQLAKDYGFLAEVALEQSRWDEAHQLAGQALQILTEIPNLQSNEFGSYRFILAKSQQGLGQFKVAINSLQAAKAESNHQYNPQLYISILERLRSLYFEQGEYLKAFNIKQKQLQLEQQYGFRAFVGASYLNPQRQVISSAQLQVENPETIAQEIAASGRGQDVKRLRERIGGTEHKLTVIHGQSGVGKSSILQGGLIPALQQEAIGERDALPILLRVYTDWVGMLGQSLAKAFEEVRGNKLFANLDSSAAILEQLRRNADRNLLTVLMFDQFEEFFFVYLDQSQRRAFYEFLRVCLDIHFVKIILSLREDYLHYLLELERLFNLTAINNNILDKNIRYYLGNFSPADAKTVVQSLTERSHFYLEPALIDELVRDLAGELGEVRPIELQIVGTQLQTEKITTLDKYLKFGTKEKLVERFLEEVIHDCGAENEQVAQLVLYLLTDENGTRPLKTRAELAADLVAEVEKLDLVLDIFVASRLVLLLPESPADRYQLVHDYLVSFIRQQQGSGLLVQLEKVREQQKLTEEELKREQEARQILADAKREADQQIQQGRKRLALSSGLAITFIVAAGISSLYAVNKIREANIANKRKQEAEIKVINATANLNYVNQEKKDALNNKQIAEVRFRESVSKSQKANENLVKLQESLHKKIRQQSLLLAQNQQVRRQVAAVTEKLRSTQEAADKAKQEQSQAFTQAQQAEKKLRQAQQARVAVEKNLEKVKLEQTKAQIARARAESVIQSVIANAGAASFAQREPIKAVDYYNQSLVKAKQNHDVGGELTALTNLAIVYHTLGNFAKSLEYYQQALAISQQLKNRGLEGSLLNNIGQVYQSLGQYSKAIEYQQQALAISKEVGDRALEGSLLNNLGQVYQNLGQYAEALECYQQALAISKEVGDRALEGSLLSNLGEAYRDLQDWQKALEYYQQALAISKQVGNRTLEAFTFTNLGLTYGSLKNYPIAIEYYQQALAISKQVGNRAAEASLLKNLGQVYQNLGQYAKALKYYQQALAISKEVGDRALEGLLLSNLGQAYNGLGQYLKAIEYYQQALDISREIKYVQLEIYTLANLGAIYSAMGDSGKALEYQQHCLTTARYINNPQLSKFCNERY
ncbi:tetratricopeptide repeat protein [Nostoc sp.]|uniref:tetratricopeptide repeat protein n=1 Tax=Nostoc sp. TaxID=1180 RepID=UPI002FF52B02